MIDEVAVETCHLLSGVYLFAYLLSSAMTTNYTRTTFLPFLKTTTAKWQSRHTFSAWLS